MNTFKKAYSTSSLDVVQPTDIINDTIEEGYEADHDYFSACSHYGEACEEILQRTGREDPCVLYLYARTIYLAVASMSTTNPLVMRESVTLLEQAKCLLTVAKLIAKTERFSDIIQAFLTKLEQLQAQLTMSASRCERLLSSQQTLDPVTVDNAVLVVDG